MQIMERLSIGRTVFIIAHRLSTLKNCDLLLGIEKGQIAFIRSDVAKAIGDPFTFATVHPHDRNARDEGLGSRDATRRDARSDLVARREVALHASL